jgi:hypothetical protein
LNCAAKLFQRGRRFVCSELRSRSRHAFNARSRIFYRAVRRIAGRIVGACRAGGEDRHGHPARNDSASDDGSDAHAHPNSDSDPDANAKTFCVGIRIADADTNADAFRVRVVDADTNANADADAYTYAEADAHADAQTDGDTSSARLGNIVVVAQWAILDHRRRRIETAASDRTSSR